MSKGEELNKKSEMCHVSLSEPDKKAIISKAREERESVSTFFVKSALMRAEIITK